LKPPDVLQWPEELDSRVVFLAGSIDEGATEPWQSHVISALEDLDLVVLNPRRDEWDASLLRDQVKWELDGLERAALIAMYFAPESKAPVTLLELGLFARSERLVVCCPEGYWRRGNVEIVCRRYGAELFETLEQLVDRIREHAKRR
jgi:hypothetical protein